MTDFALHEECWLLLPWLANGRLPQAQRTRLDEHLRDCEQCASELAQQRLLCTALAAPERVTYAPGPSFRKLLERLEATADGAPPARRHTRMRSPRSRTLSTWRPPGLAWAASFLLVLACGALIATAYRWSQPVYVTHTSTAARAPEVLHIAFLPSLPIAEAGAVLRAAGARVVEGPDASGIFGVTALSSGASGMPDAGLRTLAAHLRADARVRWVEPLETAGPAAPPGPPGPPEH